MKTTIRIFVLTALLTLAICPMAFAADGETLYDGTYCFREEDFSTDPAAQLSGIFVTDVPEEDVAAVCLGARKLRAGDVLPTQALDSLQMVPLCKENCNAEFGYRPIYGTVLGEPAELNIRICSGKNETPKAIGAEFETYKNIANDGRLTGSDPENAPLTFQLVEQPKRGKVVLKEDGSYIYTPDKNKVGEDRFTFTVTDEAGNVSKPATVQIKIIKPSQAMTFADMDGNDSLFEAVWACNAELTGGRSIGGTLCFCPNETVSRAEFLVMAMKLGGIQTDEALTVSGFSDAKEAAAWLQPYLAAAMRQGIVHGEVTQSGLMFRPNDAITGHEAAVVLQNMLKLPVETASYRPAAYAWSADALQALSEAGLTVAEPSRSITRAEAVDMLHQVSLILK